MVKSKGVIWHH